MLISRRDFAIACTAGSALAVLTACSNSHGRGDAQHSASALLSNQQEGAPHPADMEHLTRDSLVGFRWLGVSFRWYCGVGGLVVGH